MLKRGKKTKCTLQAPDISFILLSWIELFELLKMKKETMLARVRRFIRISSMEFDFIDNCHSWLTFGSDTEIHRLCVFQSYIITWLSILVFNNVRYLYNHHFHTFKKIHLLLCILLISFSFDCQINCHLFVLMPQIRAPPPLPFHFGPQWTGLASRSDVSVILKQRLAGMEGLVV